MDLNLYARKTRISHDRHWGVAADLALWELSIIRRTLHMRPHQLDHVTDPAAMIQQCKRMLFVGRLGSGFLRIEPPKSDSDDKCFLPKVLRDPKLLDNFVADVRKNMQGHG